MSECELQMRQNESLHVAINPNANGLSDGKSTGPHRVAHAVWRENYAGPLIAFIRFPCSDLHYAQVES